MKYALLEHMHSFAGLINYGDHIQSLAAEQYLPNVDFYVERDYLNKSSYEKAKIIMNGWFTHEPQNWPPNENLIPFFISFHLSPEYADQLLSKKESVKYLQTHAPIGCRDYKTVEILEKYGIEAYYSFCLTATLDKKYKSNTRNNNIYFVDILYPYDQRIVYKSDPKRLIYHTLNGRIFKVLNIKKKKNILKSLIPNDVIVQSQEISQFCSSKLSTPQKFAIAKEALSKYASAKIVVTSRIHCALPCLAMGTPVLFIMDGLNSVNDLARLDGTLDHLNILSRDEKEINKLFSKKMNVIHPEDINWDNPPQNPTSYLPLAEELKKKCIQFINS